MNINFRQILLLKLSFRIRKNIKSYLIQIGLSPQTLNLTGIMTSEVSRLLFPCVFKFFRRPTPPLFEVGKLKPRAAATNWAFQSLQGSANHMLQEEANFCLLYYIKISKGTPHKPSSFDTWCNLIVEAGLVGRWKPL